MDGVPFVTQLPIPPGESFTYEFVAKPAGSHMYHSHHNATDQVGRGLLGRLHHRPQGRRRPEEGVREEVRRRLRPRVHLDLERHARRLHHQRPRLPGDRAGPRGGRREACSIRFMNEGIMMHPWHSHGFRMQVVARDGAPLGTAAFDADTLGVNPGERWDAVITADRPGVWAFHCHILPHVEGLDGMFGMVTHARSSSRPPRTWMPSWRRSRRHTPAAEVHRRTRPRRQHQEDGAHRDDPPRHRCLAGLGGRRGPGDRAGRAPRGAAAGAVRRDRDAVRARRAPARDRGDRPARPRCRRGRPGA